jgi:hypothetical protein
MTDSPLLDSLGRRRSLAAVPGYLAGRPPRSKGRRYPADPPRTEEIIAVMRCCGDGVHGARARGLIVVLWRAGLRIQEALDLNELDLDLSRSGAEKLMNYLRYRLNGAASFGFTMLVRRDATVIEQHTRRGLRRALAPVALVTDDALVRQQFSSPGPSSAAFWS